LSLRKLKLIVEKQFLNKIIPEKTFRYHLRKLLNHNYIYELKKDWKRGQKSPAYLTSTTNEQIRLKTLVIQYKGNNKDREDESLNSYLKLKKKHQQTQSRVEIELKRKMIYYIIFHVMSIETPNRHYNHPGVSVTDIINARYDGHAFYYLRLEEDRSTVEECIKKLRDENIIKEIKIDGEECRYTLVEPIWKDFVKDCSHILEHDIMLRLHTVWRNLRKPKPEERLFEENCWGPEFIDGRMKSVCSALEKNREDVGKRQLEEQAKQFIEVLDYNIVKDIRELRKKYHYLIERYAWTCNEMIETVYPEFIQKEVERVEKNKKTRDKKYPKLLRMCLSDVVGVRDSRKASQSVVKYQK
jgi:uncharacterized protein YihD (DUF1040 family)